MNFAQMRLLYNQALSGSYITQASLPSITQLNADYAAANNNGTNNVSPCWSLKNKIPAKKSTSRGLVCDKPTT